MPRRRLRLTILTLCLTALAPAPRGQDPLEEGDRLVRQGLLDEALSRYDLFKQQHPERVDAYLKSAAALLGSGRKKDASIELNDALRLQPRDAEQAREFAQAVTEAGNPVLASAVLERWLQSGSLTGRGWWLLADLYTQQRRLDEALSALGRYRESEASVVGEEELKRAMILLEKGDLEEAMSAFESVAQNNPRSSAAFHGLSKVCLFGNNPEAALSMAERAVLLDPSNGIYLLQLGAVLKELGKHEEAVPRLEEAERKGADPFSVTFSLGDAYRRIGETAKARESLQRYQAFLEQKRRDQETLQLENQANEQLERGELQAAAGVFRHLLELDPEHWVALNRIAKIHLSEGRDDQALTPIQKMLAIDPLSSEAHFLAAAYWQGQRDVHRALEHARESKRLRPGNAPLRNLLGNLLFSAGDLQGAVAEYAAASRLEPDHAGFAANLETARRRLGGN